jgi:hypothetical protein
LLVQAGLPLDAFQLPIDDPDMRQRLAESWKAGCKEVTTSQSVAKGIMGDHMIIIQEMLNCFGVTFSQGHDLSDLSVVPFSGEILAACKETHILYPGYPLSIMEMRKRISEKFFSSRDGDWYVHKPFATLSVVSARWHLVKKQGILEGALLESEQLARACDLVFAIILMKQTRKLDLFYNTRVQCFSSTSSPPVFVGCDDTGLHINENCEFFQPLLVASTVTPTVTP